MATNPLHPTVGPEDYISPYADINYSKGPKIIYGNVDVMTVILNDSQGDDDDEWGNTEQIALRMIIDEAVASHQAVFGWSGIVGLQGQMAYLLQFFGNYDPTFQANTAQVLFTIGSTVLSNGSLIFGTGTSFTPSALTMGAGSVVIQPSGLTELDLSVSYPAGSNTQFTEISVVTDDTEPYVSFTFNNSSSYFFSSTSFQIPVGASFSASSASFDSLVGGVMTGTSLALTGNLTFPTSTSGTNPLSNYIFGTAGGVADGGDVLTLTSNDIEFYIKTNSVVGFVESRVLWYSVGPSLPYPITLNISSYVNINEDLTITGANGGKAIINFLTSNTSILTVSYDGGNTNWVITGAATFAFGDLQDTNQGVSIYNNRSGFLTGIEIGTPTIDLKILANLTQISSLVSSSGLEFSQVGASNNVTLNNLGMYLAQAEAPWNYLSLTYSGVAQYTDTTLNFSIDNTGISTGQPYPIKWHVHNIPGQSWPDSSTSPASFSVLIPNETVDISNKTWGITVAVINSFGTAFSSGSNTYAVNYAYNPGNGMQLTFSIPGPLSVTPTLSPALPPASEITAGTVTIRVTIFYTDTDIHAIVI